MSDKDTLRAIRALATQGDVAGAGELARQALERGLRHPFAYGVIAMSLETSGRLEDAVRVLDEALEQYPDEPGSLQARGLLLLRLERFDAARADFERVTLLAPHVAAGFTALGQALEALGVGKLFGPGTPTTAPIDFVREYFAQGAGERNG